MSGIAGGWSRDETLFAVMAVIVLALGILRLDLILFRPKNKPPAPQPPTPRKHRVGYVIETEEEAKRRFGKR